MKEATQAGKYVVLLDTGYITVSPSQGARIETSADITRAYNFGTAANAMTVAKHVKGEVVSNL